MSRVQGSRSGTKHSMPVATEAVERGAPVGGSPAPAESGRNGTMAMGVVRLLVAHQVKRATPPATSGKARLRPAPGLGSQMLKVVAPVLSRLRRMPLAARANGSGAVPKLWDYKVTSIRRCSTR